ncbi:MAG: glycosyltransferase family 4 protein [Anaerolineae bacterium]|nr:glycosyltransferase family 4 protein [Anaerolineae bacterium]
MTAHCIVVGPENQRHVTLAAEGLAPRIAYREIARQCDARIYEAFPSSSGLCGPKPVRLFGSLAANTLAAFKLVHELPTDSLIYTTSETWGLPVSIAIAMSRRDLKHVMYVHRVFSRKWRGVLHALGTVFRVDGWLCNTQYQKQYLQGLRPLEHAPVAAVSQGVDTHFYDPSPTQRDAGEGYILSVGMEMRDYSLLCQAIVGLGKKVVVRASSAWMQEARNRYGAALPNITWIRERLEFVQLRELYAGAALVVVPLHDTLQAAGITTIHEAMAMGRCVVVTQTRGLPDSLRHGYNGIVTSPDATTLQETLRQLLRTPETLAALGRAARQTMTAQFSVEHHTQAVLAFLARFGGSGQPA